MRWFVFLLIFSGAVNAAISVFEFDTDEQTLRYQKLIAELRCLVCQNQNLADSNAELAVDLKTIVHQKILAGETDQQILSFMTDRYGDFVLYNPPLKTSTLLLWLGPTVFLILGLFVVILYIKKSKRDSVAQLSQQQRENIRQMLEKD